MVGADMDARDKTESPDLTSCDAAVPRCGYYLYYRRSNKLMLRPHTEVDCLY
jgi:hypothetical protein